ncbi:hypothetical protein ACHAXR_001182 [Thalassiosira sp. AJA248-18]
MTLLAPVKVLHNVQCLAFLMTHGPKYGYFPEPDKCYYICKDENEGVAKAAFEQHGLVINFTGGRRYLGGFIGSNCSMVYLGPQGSFAKLSKVSGAKGSTASHQYTSSGQGCTH